MQDILQVIRNESAFVKSLFLMLIAIPITFIVQLIFYFIIHIWTSIFNKDKSKSLNNKK
jgi:diacylglycerol kinase